MFKLEKIKAPIEVLKPVDVNHLPLGYQYINHAYPNILLLAKKNSGKTNIIYNILKKCANKHTEIVIFCPTWELDDTYRQILEYLDSKGIPHQQFKNIDNLKDLMDSYDKGYQSEGSDEEGKDDWSNLQSTKEEGIVSNSNTNTIGVSSNTAEHSSAYHLPNLYSYIYSPTKEEKIEEEQQEMKPKK